MGFIRPITWKIDLQMYMGQKLFNPPSRQSPSRMGPDIMGRSPRLSHGPNRPAVVGSDQSRLLNLMDGSHCSAAV
jgi:hypothetical protein